MSKASEIEQQFARQFVAADWPLFKRMADANLSEAAHLRKRDMRASGVNPLLARNVRKRLLIGLGSELLLKALFLKAGYAINLPRGKASTFPVRLQDVGNEPLQTKTATFDQCLSHLDRALTLQDGQDTTEGLKIAKVFRNKEAHSVIDQHAFDPDTYRMVERSLMVVYQYGFSEDLVVRIAMTKNDKAVWKIKGIRQ